jgi:hypothetical protein
MCIPLSLQGNGSVNCIPPFGARQRLGQHVPAATNTRYNIRIVGRVIFYAVRVLSKESLGLYKNISVRSGSTDIAVRKLNDAIGILEPWFQKRRIKINTKLHDFPNDCVTIAAIRVQ